MLRSRIVLFMAVALFLFVSTSSAEMNVYSLTSLGYTALEHDSGINAMHRNDDPFNPLRVQLFMDKWVSENIGVFLEFLWDAGSPPTGSKTKPRVNGAYAVMKLSDNDRLNLKFGLIPLSFGTWAPRTYEDRNPLVGIPLMQHYITALKGGSLATSADELKSWRSSSDGFLTVMYDACWPYGIEAFGFFSKFEYSIALTKEAMSNPGAYTNDGAQVIGRFGARLSPGLRLGVSGEYGSYLSKGASGIPSSTKLEDVNQMALGFDFHYTVAHTTVTAEAIRNIWENPNLSDDTGCNSWYLEAKQVLLPGLFAAIRFDQMLFDNIKDSSGKSFHWDYNVTRVESGFGYHVNRNALIKLVWQHNQIEGNDNVDLLCTKCIFKL